LKGTSLSLLAAFAASVPLAAQERGRRVEGDFLNEQGSRHYAVWLPARLTAGMPLVVVLHACLQGAADIARGTGFDSRADDSGFLVLYPEQPDVINPARCWRWFAPEHQGRGEGEPALIAALARRVADEHRADPRRIYIVGMGAGGSMAVNVIASYPDVFAAAAIHSAVPYRSAATPAEAFSVMRYGQADDSLRPESVLAAAGTGPIPEPRPLLIVHGGRDSLTIARNGDQLARQWALAFERVVGRRLAMTAIDSVVNGRPVRRARFVDGDRLLIDHWTVRELGHAWAGDPSATELMTEFFGLRPR
jgi:poly(hydroxyalkanoate) depolymerase family esterase